MTTKAGDRRKAGPKDHAGHPESSITVRLFDAERTDATLELGPALRRRLPVRQLLWIDVEGQLDGASADVIGRKMRLKPSTREALERPTGGPYIALHGLYFHIRIATEADHDPSESPR